jgi:NADH-ubiquinone oxidoreductase chain 5
MFIGSLALAGFPFLTGFYSKDLILEVFYGKYTSTGHFCYYLGTVSAFLTAFYSTRLIYLTFLSKPNRYKSVTQAAFDSSIQICVALSCLAIPSIFIGFYTKDMLVGLGSNFWGNAIYVQPENMNLFDAEFSKQFYKLLPVTVSIFGITLAFLFYEFQSKLLFQLKISFFLKKVYNFLTKKWFFDKVYNEWVSQFFFKFSYSNSYKIVDRGIFEMVGPRGLSLVTLKVSSQLAKLQTGYLYHYTFLILIGSTLLLRARQLWLVFGTYADYRISLIFFIFGFIIVNKV